MTDAKRVTYTLEAADRRTRLIDPDGGRTSYVFDDKNRTLGAINPQGKRTSFAYDLGDRLRRQKHGNGSLVTHLYDAGNQLGQPLRPLQGAAVAAFDDFRRQLTAVKLFAENMLAVEIQGTGAEQPGVAATVSPDPHGDFVGSGPVRDLGFLAQDPRAHHSRAQRQGSQQGSGQHAESRP